MIGSSRLFGFLPLLIEPKTHLDKLVTVTQGDIQALSRSCPRPVRSPQPDLFQASSCMGLNVDVPIKHLLGKACLYLIHDAYIAFDNCVGRPNIKIYLCFF